MSQVTQRQSKRRQPVLIDEDLAVFRFEGRNQLLRLWIKVLMSSGVRRRTILRDHQRGLDFIGPSLGPLLSKDVPHKPSHFFTRSNQFVVTVKGAVLPGP
jgi:hypothetical protein